MGVPKGRSLPMRQFPRGRDFRLPNATGSERRGAAGDALDVRKSIGLILVAFALGSAVFALVKGARQSTNGSEPSPARKVIVYYFHGTVSCASCDRIEAFGREAVETGFAPQIQSGAVEWREVNTDEATGEHFVKDYGLLTRSIVISDVRHGTERRWKNLDRVWELLDDKAAFERYVQDEVGAYMVVHP